MSISNYLRQELGNKHIKLQRISHSCEGTPAWADSRMKKYRRREGQRR